MKKLLSKFLMACIVIVAIACSDESLDPNTAIETQTGDPVPLPLDYLKRKSTRSAEGNNRIAAISQKWFNNPNDVSTSMFYREGDQIFEEDKDKIQFTFSIWIEDGGPFLYVQDLGRSFYLALPIHNPGNYARAWFWDNAKSKWVEWREFKYSDCTNDKEPPSLLDPCNPYYCHEMLTETNRFPSQVNDWSWWLYSALELKDNCDDDLTIVQTPPPGTIVESPRKMILTFEITDNNNNRTVTKGTLEVRKITL